MSVAVHLTRPQFVAVSIPDIRDECATNVLRTDEPKGVMSDGGTRSEPTDPRHRSALLVALRTGLLRKCPVHGEVYDPGQHDYQGACMVASFLVNRDDPLVAPFAGDRAPLTDLLRSICAAYTLHCSQCTGARNG